MGGVVLGYKIRRILKNNKHINNLKYELIDLWKFAISLKQEL